MSTILVVLGHSNFEWPRQSSAIETVSVCHSFSEKTQRRAKDRFFLDLKQPLPPVKSSFLQRRRIRNYRCLRIEHKCFERTRKSPHPPSLAILVKSQNFRESHILWFRLLAELILGQKPIFLVQKTVLLVIITYFVGAIFGTNHLVLVLTLCIAIKGATSFSSLKER